MVIKGCNFGNEFIPWLPNIKKRTSDISDLQKYHLFAFFISAVKFLSITFLMS